MTPGALNTISAVAGVEVGLVTLIEGDGTFVVGKGPSAPASLQSCHVDKR